MSETRIANTTYMFRYQSIWKSATNWHVCPQFYFFMSFCIFYRIISDIEVRHTRRRKYILNARSNKITTEPYTSFQPIPNEQLENVHRLRMHRDVVPRVRSIDLTKKPLPHVEVPRPAQLSTVKTESEHYRKVFECNFLNIVYSFN